MAIGKHAAGVVLARNALSSWCERAATKRGQGVVLVVVDTMLALLAAVRRGRSTRGWLVDHKALMRMGKRHLLLAVQNVLGGLIVWVDTDRRTSMTRTIR